MESLTIEVNGMFCKHCVKSVTSALKDLKSVKNVVVSLDDCTATLEYDADTITIVDVRRAIKDAGYVPA
ncbi:MAG: cation transporter [Oscillospiraceae bacterium]|jgi:copper chaperone CopZ|nr:cation transporter [Oscillospiraceae bacterium]